MTPFVLRFLEHVHGSLGWLAALALCHPATLLRRPRRRALAVAAAATALTTLVAAIGATLYPAYRATVKPLLYAASSVAGDAFERKEHLGVFVVVLAWVGLLSHWSACNDRSTGSARSLARVAFVAYAAAAALAVFDAALGIFVSAHREF